MSPKTAFTINSLPATNAFQSDGSAKSEESTETSDNSLFEHFAWLYIFCREKLFRDDTQRMIRALWPSGKARTGEKLIELGCGPGFYSCNLAARFPELSVIGVDRSPSQLSWARQKRTTLG